MKKRQGGDTELLVFYSFNGNMEHDELVRQLRELAAQGVTGFFCACACWAGNRLYAGGMVCLLPAVCGYSGGTGHVGVHIR